MKEKHSRRNGVRLFSVKAEYQHTAAVALSSVCDEWSGFLSYEGEAEAEQTFSLAFSAAWRKQKGRRTSEIKTRPLVYNKKKPFETCL